jgi:hypothetical protein
MPSHRKGATTPRGNVKSELDDERDDLAKVVVVDNVAPVMPLGPAGSRTSDGYRPLQVILET